MGNSQRMSPASGEPHAPLKLYVQPAVTPPPHAQKAAPISSTHGSELRCLLLHTLTGLTPGTEGEEWNLRCICLMIGRLGCFPFSAGFLCVLFGDFSVSVVARLPVSKFTAARPPRVRSAAQVKARSLRSFTGRNLELGWRPSPGQGWAAAGNRADLTGLFAVPFQRKPGRS